MELPSQILSSSFFANHWLTCFIGAVLLFVVYRRITTPLSHLPGPEISKWTSAVYTYYYLKGTMPIYVHQLHGKYGPIVRIAPDQVDICDADAVKEIHRTNSRFLKTDFYRKLVSNAAHNVFSTTDTRFHSLRRRLLASPISDSSLTRLEPLIAEKINLTVTRICQEMESRGVADVFKWWLFMTTDIIGELSFGQSFGMLESGKKNQYSLDLEKLSSFGAIRTTFPFLIKFGKYIPLPLFKESAAAANRLTLYSAQCVGQYKEHLAQNPLDAKQTLFTKLFDTEKSGLSMADIRQEAQSYIVAGSDTTAVTMSYLTHGVCSDSRVREKLNAELDSIPSPITDKSLRDLPYLNQVVNESLRLYTAVPAGLPRLVPEEGADFNGYHLPGGITVATQSYSLHRDPKVFSEPDSFKPERWENPTKEMKDVFLPFGGGSRICLGMHLARRELRLATALFFRALPDARPSAKDGMSDSDMKMVSSFLMAPEGHRCLIEA